MKYTSTRDKSVTLNFSDALAQNLSRDGGLFVPSEFPLIDISQLNSNLSYSEFAFFVLKYLFPTTYHSIAVSNWVTQLDANLQTAVIIYYLRLIG